MRLLTVCPCRFGNFIGEEVESEVASQSGLGAGDYVYDDEPEETGDGQDEHMEVDGKLRRLL